MSEPKKLFLLDAYALIYRAYFAFSKNPRINSKGLNTSAIFGFTNTLIDVLYNQKPTHIGVAFDTSAPTKRHEVFPEYKANREAMPEDLRASIPYIKQLIEGFNIPILSMDGYEADDIIGTLSAKAEEDGFEVFMMTPDKDYGQLVTEKVKMYRPARGGGSAEIWGIDEIKAKFQIERTEQVIDILGLMGDAVDNIPGVPGVGEKTAQKLIAQYDSMEGIYAHVDEIKGKLGEKVANNKEQAFLSRDLATIDMEVPVAWEPEKLVTEPHNQEALTALFQELEFRALAQKILGTTATPVPEQQGQMDLFGSTGNATVVNDEPVSLFNSFDAKKVKYELVAPQKANTLLDLLKGDDPLCWDTETTGLDTYSAELVGIAFSKKAHTGYYLSIPEDRNEAKKVLAEIEPLFQSNRLKIGHNLKYDLAIMLNYDIEVAGPLFDTMIAHYLLEPDNGKRSMDALATQYLNYQPVSIETLIGPKGKDQKSMRDVPLEQQSDYACEDADITFRLYEKFKAELTQTHTLELMQNIESPLIQVLLRMEREGINVNVGAFEELSAELQQEIVVAEEKIIELAGTPFNIASPKQVGQILFEHLKITDKPKKTKTGQYATNEEVLTQLLGTHPIIDQILTYRELVKLKNTYVDTLPTMVHADTGRIHTTYNQVVAATGRLSSDKPNLQNIPIRTERGRSIRKAFIPRNEEFELLAADYSQIELRIMAELSGDVGMQEAFLNNQDIHTATAAKVYGVALDQVSSEMRRNAKMVNFGIIYGISAFGLSQRLHISRTEAKEIIDTYFEQYPGIKQFMDESIEKAREKGYVETVMGRRRYLRDINSRNATVRGFAERNAINAPIQGSAADLIKKAMIDIDQAIRAESMQSKMILQVHDELVFDMHPSEAEALKLLVKEKMENAWVGKVPFKVEMDQGKNWLEAH